MFVSIEALRKNPIQTIKSCIANIMINPTAAHFLNRNIPMRQITIKIIFNIYKSSKLNGSKIPRLVVSSSKDKYIASTTNKDVSSFPLPSDFLGEELVVFCTIL